jgi:hypothetical protein
MKAEGGSSRAKERKGGMHEDDDVDGARENRWRKNWR